MRLRVMLAVVLAAIVLTATPATASAADIASPVTCTLPESNADSLELLNTYYQGYWWDHTDLTIAVQSHPAATSRNSIRSTMPSRSGQTCCSHASTAPSR